LLIYKIIFLREEKEITNSQGKQTQATLKLPVGVTNIAPHTTPHAYLYFLKLGKVPLIHVQIPNMAHK
jgi:hypothetical protein